MADFNTQTANWSLKMRKISFATSMAILGIAATSLAGCMTDKELAKATPQEKARDCTKSKIAGVITGIPGGLIGMTTGYALMSNNPSCPGERNKTKTVLEERAPQPHTGRKVAWRDPDTH